MLPSYTSASSIPFDSLKYNLQDRDGANHFVDSLIETLWIGGGQDRDK